MIQHLADFTMEERITAAGQPHGFQPAGSQLVDELRRALQGQLFFGAQVLLVAEVAGHVAAIRQVQLDV